MSALNAFAGRLSPDLKTGLVDSIAMSRRKDGICLISWGLSLPDGRIEEHARIAVPYDGLKRLLAKMCAFYDVSGEDIEAQKAAQESKTPAVPSEPKQIEGGAKPAKAPKAKEPEA